MIDLGKHLKRTNRKCLEGRIVFEFHAIDGKIRYVYLTPSKKMLEARKISPYLGVPRLNIATLLNGWYFNEKKKIFELYEDGLVVDTATELDGMQEGILQ